MANWVKIATFGKAPLQLTDDPSPQELTDRMIRRWTESLQAVLPDRPDLIVLPECCDRPADYPIEKRIAYYKVRQNQVRDALADIAKKNRCHIAYSACRPMEDGSFRNSTAILGRDGRVLGVYNKNHLVMEETTEMGILCGKDAPIIECDFGRVACLICFDLNFDELLQTYVRAKPDLLVFSSMYHGGLMQGYWAYRCRCHFVGAVAGLPSEIRNPQGEVIAGTTNYFDHIVASVNLDCRLAHLDYHWDKLRAIKAKYGPDVTIHDPGLLGSVLITSNSPSVSAEEMVREFQVELLDDYFTRAMAHHHNPKNIEP
jgi:hypothetical protein